jgi:hypothetical protein
MEDSSGSFVFFWIFLWVFISIVCGSFSSGVARQKGYSRRPWFLGGLLFGPFALIAAAGLPDKRLWSLALFGLIRKDMPPDTLGLFGYPDMTVRKYFQEWNGPIPKDADKHF